MLPSLPEPTYFSAGRESHQMYPYAHQYVLNTLKNLGLNLPFPRLLDRSYGVSTCERCGQTYAGAQLGPCERRIWCYFDAYGRKYGSKEEWRGNRCWSSELAREAWDQCDGSCKWSLAEEFQEQQQFFHLVEQFYPLMKRATGWNDEGFDGEKMEREVLPWKKYPAAFPPGVGERLSYLQALQQIEELNFKVEKCVESLKFMAEKMNAAGVSLTF